MCRVLSLSRSGYYGVGPGELYLETAWLPERVSLLPFGLYLADQKMQLPPPLL